MILYHGSYLEIDKPDLIHSRDNVDFGKGFYLTSDFGQACKFVKTSIRKALVNGVDVENDRMGYVYYNNIPISYTCISCIFSYT